ncbi:SIS domain-containing protein [Pediococcus sp. EKM202D]|uniref:SIS domain-containing protein n=1 Tax=unclassified Pediococcus TaxID=554805 RepID=UPI00142E8823|nr:MULTISPECIES: SIS domain-containing protein [unclassified Pediococcus]KAF5438900.1 SIS domain-containing protein [Pediococcus sp. EKM202D]KAF5439103.1 SIS domain-containing protein [Pediococcus sp. EKM201D]
MDKPTMLTYIYSEQAKMLSILDQYPLNIDKALNKIPKDVNKILVLATGSSYNAALSSKYYFEKITNIQMEIQEPYNYSHYEKIDKHIDAVIGISQSGQSTATIEALKKVKQDHPVFSIGVTSLPKTEISEETDTILDILIGREHVGYVTLGFTATVLNMMLLAIRIAAVNHVITSEQELHEIQDLKKLALNIDNVINKTESFIKQHIDSLTKATQFTSIAYGPSVGTCSEMATKFSEVVRVPSQGFELEAFMHGPYLEVNKDHYIFFIETNSQKSIYEKELSLKTYEKKYVSNLYTINFREETSEDEKQLDLINIEDEYKVPFISSTVFQLLAWYISKSKGIDLSKLIFTDFSTAVHNKTVPQKYV